MTGQGSPNSIACTGANRVKREWVSGVIYRSSHAFLCAMLVVSWVFTNCLWSAHAVAQSLQTDSAAKTTNLRLRISLGGGEARRWTGRLFADKQSAKFVNLEPRGLNADANYAIRLEQGVVHIEHAVQTAFNSVDVSFQGGVATKINVELASLDQPEEKVTYTVPVSSLLSDGDHREIDQAGNRCSIERVPGDKLTFEVDRPHLIFQPGEQMEFSIGANLTSFVSTDCQCRFAVLDARRSKSAITPWAGSVSFACDESGSAPQLPMNLEVPADEGVYDLLIELQPSGFQPGFGSRPKLVRKVQFVVLEDSVPSANKLPFQRETWKQFARYSPRQLMESSKNSWSSSLTNSLAQLKSGKLGLNGTGEFYGNTRRKLVPGDGGEALQFEPGGWQAIPISAPAKKGPCLVEVDCLVEGETALGISLLQFDSVGQINSSNQDAGLFVERSAFGTELRSIQTYRLYFWPNETNAWLVLANRHAEQSAKVVEVRVLNGPARIPENPKSTAGSTGSVDQPGRGMMAFLETPGFPENFGASEYVDANLGQPLDDWVTFYQGIDRFIQHLKARGLTGAFVTVASDGSGLYPSQTLKHGPLYDTGCFKSDGGDPVRKDVLELMFRMFERERLRLIPVVTLNGPLSGIRSIEEVDLVDYNGRKLPAGGMQNLPRYNPLAVPVQQAVENVIEELTGRYRHHKSFRGVAITCRPDTVTLLPGQQWACDRLTIDRYLRTAEVDVADQENLRNHSDRMNLLMGSHRESWLAWRSEQMTDFYERLQQIVEKTLDGGLLYLAPVDLYRNAEIASYLNPGLHASSDYRGAMQRSGFEFSKLEDDAQDQSIVVLNSHRISPADSLASRRADAHVATLDQMNEWFRLRRQPGDLFVHRGSWVHFAQLEQEAPFQQQQNSLMRNQQLMPVGQFNRRRFIERLFASDSQMLVDSSWAIPVLEDESLASFQDVYSRLPEVKFQEVKAVDSDENSEISSRSLPVVVRQVSTGDATWFYAANSSPWPISVRIQLSSKSGESGEREDRIKRDTSFVSLSDTWTDSEFKEQFDEAGEPFIEFTIQAWSLVGGRSANPTNRLRAYSVDFPPDADLQLKKQIYRLQSLLVRATETTPLDGLTNPGFEVTDQNLADHDQNSIQFGTPLAGWSSSRGKTSKPDVYLESSDAHEGSNSLRLVNDGLSPVWIRSNEFSAPQTGRLSVTAWLKTDQPDHPLPLRIALEGESGSGPYYRFGDIGSESSADTSNQAGSQWRRFAVHFDDLPLEDLDRLRVGFDLMGPGSVNIDHVEIYDRWFDENDSKAITQLLATASTQLSTPATYDRCRRLLESYWPQFLTEHFDESRGQLAGDENPSERITEDMKGSSTIARIRSVAWPIKRTETERGDVQSVPVEGSQESEEGKFRFRNVFTTKSPEGR